MFVDRVSELASLRDVLEGRGAALCLLYGRRRLGKTYLLREAFPPADTLYFTVPQQSMAGILRSLNDDIARETGLPLAYISWKDLLVDLPRIGHRVVVFDEVQRLFSADPGAVSALQEVWDNELHRSELVVVLCGSVIGMMQRLVHAHAPLYGRFAWNLNLRPMRYHAVRAFHPGRTEVEKVRRYAIFGGTPHYQQMSRSIPLDRAVRDLFLRDGAPFRDEPRILFEIEMRSAERYHEVMEAIGLGAQTIGEIAGRYGEKATTYMPYVEKLRDDLHLIERRDPVGGKQRRGRFRFSDPFFHFYYRYVYPNASRLDRGDQRGVEQDIRKDVEAYYGVAFERVVEQHLSAISGSEMGGVRLDLHGLGGWWDGEDELDVVALTKDAAIAVEAKFRNQPPKADEISRFMDRARRFQELTNRRRLVTMIFTRTRPRAKAAEVASDEGITVFGLDDLASVYTTGDHRR